MSDTTRRAQDALQTFDTDVLVAIAMRELDMMDLAMWELAARGLDCDGRWVGLLAEDLTTGEAML